MLSWTISTWNIMIAIFYGSHGPRQKWPQMTSMARVDLQSYNFTWPSGIEGQQLNKSIFNINSLSINGYKNDFISPLALWHWYNLVHVFYKCILWVIVYTLFEFILCHKSGSHREKSDWSGPRDLPDRPGLRDQMVLTHCKHVQKLYKRPYSFDTQTLLKDEINEEVSNIQGNSLSMQQLMSSTFLFFHLNDCFVFWWC